MRPVIPQSRQRVYRENYEWGPLPRRSLLNAMHQDTHPPHCFIMLAASIPVGIETTSNQESRS